ncbi:FAD-dependent oxidoreductase [Halomonas mongoliensis]|uniref:FAD-dependent oxidoreductase n=1 Tax=Halomonas mongoliensis TaxID=321265 RepID=UPI00403AF5DA
MDPSGRYLQGLRWEGRRACQHHPRGAPAEPFVLIERHGIDCQASRSGTLHLCHNAKGERELARRADQPQQRAAPVELVEDEACWNKLGTRRIRRALLNHRAGKLDPIALPRQLPLPERCSTLASPPPARGAAGGSRPREAA